MTVRDTKSPLCNLKLFEPDVLLLLLLLIVIVFWGLLALVRLWRTIGTESFKNLFKGDITIMFWLLAAR